MHHLRNVVTSHPPYRHTTPTSTSLYSPGQTGQQCPGAGTRCSWNIVHHLYIQVPPCPPPPPYTHPHSPCRHTTPKSTSLYSPGQTGQHCPGTGLSRNIVRHLHIQVPPPTPHFLCRHTTPDSTSLYSPGQTGQHCPGTGLSRNIVRHLHIQVPPPPPTPHFLCRHTTPDSTSLYSPGQTGQHCPGTGLSRNIVRHLHIQVPPPHPPTLRAGTQHLSQHLCTHQDRRDSTVQAQAQDSHTERSTPPPYRWPGPRYRCTTRRGRRATGSWSWTRSGSRGSRNLFKTTAVHKRSSPANPWVVHWGGGKSVETTTLSDAVTIMRCVRGQLTKMILIFKQTYADVL